VADDGVQVDVHRIVERSGRRLWAGEEPGAHKDENHYSDEQDKHDDKHSVLSFLEVV
jgi:hypothetical protein